MKQTAHALLIESKPRAAIFARKDKSDLTFIRKGHLVTGSLFQFEAVIWPAV